MVFYRLVLVGVGGVGMLHLRVHYQLALSPTQILKYFFFCKINATNLT